MHIKKNIAYLSVMLYLLNNENSIPEIAEELVTKEAAKITKMRFDTSAIFGYQEDYTQYKVRGHYTRLKKLSRYFKAKMYAGRMGFLLQGSNRTGINQTRMALLLVPSFYVETDSEKAIDIWERIYSTTAFFAGNSDDLTIREYYNVWKKNGAPKGDTLADDLLVKRIINNLKDYRNPKINSMLVWRIKDNEEETKDLRLMGSRFVPDSYIFQQLTDDYVSGRMMPKGLDIFSVFGSERASHYCETERTMYKEYNMRMKTLQNEFAGLTADDWTQNLYWAWLYSLFPLLKSTGKEYPGFMQNTAWADKALMTASASWAELRHDTLLYTMPSFIALSKHDILPFGYVEPYLELYARLKSLTQMMTHGLGSRHLLNEKLQTRLEKLAEIYGRLADISIKELENKQLTEDDIK